MNHTSTLDFHVEETPFTHHFRSISCRYFNTASRITKDRDGALSSSTISSILSSNWTGSVAVMLAIRFDLRPRMSSMLPVRIEVSVKAHSSCWCSSIPRRLRRRTVNVTSPTIAPARIDSAGKPGMPPGPLGLNVTVNTCPVVVTVIVRVVEVEPCVRLIE